MVQVWIAVVVTLAAGTLVAFRWSKALKEVTRGISALGDGRPTRPTLMRVGGPVGRLARIFDTVSPLLEERIARLEQMTA